MIKPKAEQQGWEFDPVTMDVKYIYNMTNKDCYTIEQCFGLITASKLT
jgi:hypothetical protein